MKKQFRKSKYLLIRKYEFRMLFGKALLFAAVSKIFELHPISILVKSKKLKVTKHSPEKLLNQSFNEKYFWRMLKSIELRKRHPMFLKHRVSMIS